jgi:hypothetical protein
MVVSFIANFDNLQLMAADWLPSSTRSSLEWEEAMVRVQKRYKYKCYVWSQFSYAREHEGI